MEDICIIGGGVSGILSAKIAKSYNLNPIIIEKSSSFGGLWQGNPGNIGIWDGLVTNISRFLMTFSDHNWPDMTNAYPQGSEYLSYITTYVSKHNLLQHFHFNTEVISLDKIDEGYLIKYRNQEGTLTRTFKYVIVACGQYSKFKDCVKNKEVFKGEILLAGHFRNPNICTGKNVVVIGSGYSSCDIASMILDSARNVTLVYRKKFCINKKLIRGIPKEIYNFSFQSINKNPPLIYSLSSHGESIRKLINAFGNTGDLKEDLRITETDINSEYVAYPVASDDFYENLRNNKIKCVRGSVSEYCENGLVLDSGQVLEADLVIDATGYTSYLDFLGERIKEIADYDPRYYKIPITLYRNSIHPSLPGLGFAGFLQSFFPGNLELAAELCVRWVIGELVVTENELWDGVRIEKNYREESVSSLWVYDPVGIQKDLIRILNIEFDWNLIDSLEYRKGFLSAVFCYKNREGQEEICREYVRQIKQAFPEHRFN